MHSFLQYLKGVTPVLVLKWASVLFVIGLYILIIVAVTLSVIEGFSS